MLKDDGGMHDAVEHRGLDRRIVYHVLEVGQEIIFEDMIHYTTVKTCMFNGIGHPDIAMLHSDGRLETLRHFTYEDYRNRMD